MLLPEVVLATAGDQLKVKGAVPPVTLTVAVPLHCPLHKTLFCVLLSVNPPPDVGTVTTAVAVLQELVTVTE